MNEWYFAFNGQQVGPLSAEQLTAYAHGGQITPDTLVRLTLSGQWVPAGSVPGLFAVSNFQAVPAPVIPATPAVPMIATGVTSRPRVAVKSRKPAVPKWAIVFGVLAVIGLIQTAVSPPKPDPPKKVVPKLPELPETVTVEQWLKADPEQREKFVDKYRPQSTSLKEAFNQVADDAVAERMTTFFEKPENRQKLPRAVLRDIDWEVQREADVGREVYKLKKAMGRFAQ